MVDITTPTVGGDDDAWGGILNTALTTLENAVTVAEGSITTNATDIARLKGQVFNVTQYGAIGDDTFDSTTAIQAAINAAAAIDPVTGIGGGVVYFPGGRFTSDTLTVPSSVSLVGAGRQATRLRRRTAGVLINMSGPSTDDSGATHVKYSGISHMTVNGNSQTGTVLQCYYTNNLVFRDVLFTSSLERLVDGVEFWDSRFYNCQFESSGGTNGAVLPAVHLRNASSATPATFGYSLDNVNQIVFHGCRWENFHNGALRIEDGAVVGNNPNTIYVTDCKMETSQMQGGSHLLADDSCVGIWVDNLYAFAGGFTGGFSTAQNIITWSAQNSDLANVEIANGAVATVNSGVDLFSGANSRASLRNVIGKYTTAPTGAHIFYEASSTADFNVQNCYGTSGTQSAGTIPIRWEGQQPLKQVAGAVSDASFTRTPLNGTQGIDTTNGRLYTRVAGAWSYIPTASRATPLARFVAASNASTAEKSMADYVCDGTADNVEIQAAVDAVKAAGGGVVQLSGGGFALAATVIITGNTDEDNADTMTLRGAGAQATTLTCASGVNGIELTDWAMVNIESLGIIVDGAGVGIHSTAVLSGNEVSFWHSSFRNLRINGGFGGTNTTWGMDLAMPWRSVFENIEIEGTRNGMRLSNQGSVQNAGDCTFTRMFIEIVGTGGTAIHVSSPSNNMNQNNFNMVEIGANGTGCTGILIDGASGGASQRFWGLNAEQFQTLINVDNGESNVFDCNYVTCDTGGASNVGFRCGSNAHNNTFSAKWFNNASGDTVQIIQDNNTTSNTPNIFERIRIENNSTGTITYTKQNNTVFRDITTFNTGNAMPAGLLQYPLSVVNDPEFKATDHGLIAWSHDPATLRSTADATTSGSVYLVKIKIVNRSTIVTNVLAGIVTGGTTLTAGQCFAGLYNSSGTLLSTSADQSGNWTTAGLKEVALGAPQTLAVGTYYVALLANGTTPPTWATGCGNGQASVVNAKLSTGTSRWLVGPTAQTSLPASITLGSQTPNSGSRWVALT